MGILSWSLVEGGSKMKLFVAVFLVAAAFAEPEAKADADAALLYGRYGYTGLGYAGLGYAGLGYGYPYTYGARVIGKRSADAKPEAEPEADAALLYGSYGYTGLGYSGLGYSSLGYAGLGYAGLGYARLGYSYPYSYGARVIGKRSAD